MQPRPTSQCLKVSSATTTSYSVEILPASVLPHLLTAACCCLLPVARCQAIDDDDDNHKCLAGVTKLAYYMPED
ncbi:unnamed protein product [Ceratitis capitata]|uniref:(Mediterranean fruit fly) hypothetical protein n=1 Tax=Ceratitis capitata TaxID=7213 RepID=A0A811UN80_CERCA|nr:unnamed protein product [Ceratitis capitata]CAD7000214.1 unnamed protein product [Ceratitis capitata]